MFIPYNILLILLMPFWVLWMLSRTSKRSKPVDWDERTGKLSMRLRKDSTRVWVHAVSVGEVIAVVPVIKGLREEVPDIEIILSVTTSSGHDTALGLPEGTVDHVIYFPIDIPKFVYASLTYVRPKVIVIMETELWLNFVHLAREMGIPTVVINGRISDRAYPRMKWVKGYYKSVFRRLTRVYTQTDTDRARFLEMGAQVAETIGNCKFDQATDLGPVDTKALKAELGIPEDNVVLVIGSTRNDMEEELVISAVERLEIENLSVIHAPRHLERADAISEKVTASLGSVGRRSKGEHNRYLILDTYGELNRMYTIADLVVIGGGFDRLGGQNIIQPLALGKPVLHGSHMHNFRDVADLAVKSGASQICHNADELYEALKTLFGNLDKRMTMGAAAKNLVDSQIGSSKKYVQLIKNLINSPR